jgi:hypothetical protein
VTENTFYNGLAAGKSDILATLLELISREGIRYCVIGGLAVNAYVEPVVSLDLDIVVAASELDKLKTAAKDIFDIREFPLSINLYTSESDLRIQIQTDVRYQAFVERAQQHAVLGYSMRVACIEDVLRGKVWAYLDEGRRRSKRQKDLADIYRIVEKYPELESAVPEPILRGS